MRPIPKWLRAGAILALLAGCAPAPARAPASSAPVAISAPILGYLIEEHFGPAYALGSQSRTVRVQPTNWVDGLSARAYYRATPGAPARRITASYSPLPVPVDCPPATCTVRDGVLIRREGSPELISGRGTGFAHVSLSGPDLPAGSLPAFVALASDPRIDATTDPALAQAAEENPRWLSGALDCGSASTGAVIPLPPARGGAAEPPTPQGLAAFVASRIQGSCAGDDSSESTVAGTVYLGEDGERVTLKVTSDSREAGCEQFDDCQRRGGVAVGWQLDVPEEHPARIRLSRRIGDGPGWVVVEHVSRRADAASRDFPVPLQTLLDLVNDPRIALAVDPGINQAGEALPLTWRLAPRGVE